MLDEIKIAIDSLDGTTGTWLLAAISLADDAVSLLGSIRRLFELDDRPAERTVLSSDLSHAESFSEWRAKRPISNAVYELGQLRHHLHRFVEVLIIKKFTVYDRDIKPGAFRRQQAIA